MQRPPFACLLFLGCGCASAPRAEQHLQNELAFIVPYVDMAAEERAVRGVFTQRRLLVDERLEGTGYVALSASSLDHTRSAVRVITPRGVVLGEDGDTQDWFALGRVALLPSLSPADSSQPLLGVLKTRRGRNEGCVTLYQVLPDGRVQPVDVQVQRFGSRACVAELRALDDQRFVAQIGWPELATLGSPRLEVDIERATPRLGQAPESAPPLRLIEDGDWLDREAIRAARALPAGAPFSARHAQGVVRAALALATGRSTDQQLAAYGSALLGRIPPGSPEAEVVAATSAHIERGWSDAEPPPPELAPAAADEPPDPDAVVIEPEP